MKCSQRIVLSRPKYRWLLIFPFYHLGFRGGKWSVQCHTSWKKMRSRLGSRVFVCTNWCSFLYIRWKGDSYLVCPGTWNQNQSQEWAKKPSNATLLPKCGAPDPYNCSFPKCPPCVWLPWFPVAVRTDVDTLDHTSTAGWWYSQPSWKKELAQTSRERLFSWNPQPGWAAETGKGSSV